MPWVKKSFLFRKFCIEDWHPLLESQSNGFPKIIHGFPLSSPYIQWHRLNLGHNDLCNKLQSLKDGMCSLSLLCIRSHHLPYRL